MPQTNRRVMRRSRQVQCFRLCHNTPMTENANKHMSAYGVWKVCQVVDGLIASDSPARAICALAARRGSPNITAFERYAGIVLHDAGAPQLAELAPKLALFLVRADDRRLVTITCASPPTEALDLLANMEAAINRLGGIADALEACVAREQRENGYRIGISWAGTSFLLDNSKYDALYIEPPKLLASQEADLVFFNELDWRVVDHVARSAHREFQASVFMNTYQSVMGVWAADGSDWDIRTRMAASLEALSIPLSSTFSYDCDTQRQAVSVRFTVPGTGQFPRRMRNPAGTTLSDAVESGSVRAARTMYALRLSCLLAALCFGSGKHIEHAYVTAVDGGDGHVMASCSFDRSRYVHGTLTSIDSEELSGPSLRFDVAACASLLSADELRIASPDADDTQIEPVDDGMASQRIAPVADTRELPDGMRRLFHARLICDTDTRATFGRHDDVVEAAREDAASSPLAAISHLENIVSELEGRLCAPDDEADARALYCSNPYARVAVSLVDDHVTIGEQAQAFLDGDTEGLPEIDAPRYFRAPDALFHAYMGLSDLYERLGDTRGAEAQADRCLALAPTTAQAYYRKADILAQQQRYAEAANVLIEGLRHAISERDCALLYYHLALVFWNMGMKRESATIHVYASSLRGEFAEKSLAAVKNLRNHEDRQVIAFASPRAAARELKRLRIPVSPSDEAKMLVIRAAMGLTCTSAPEAAAPYAAALTRYFRDDPIIATTVTSIIKGTGEKGAREQKVAPSEDDRRSKCPHF